MPDPAVGAERSDEYRELAEYVLNECDRYQALYPAETAGRLARAVLALVADRDALQERAETAEESLGNLAVDAGVLAQLVREREEIVFTAPVSSLAGRDMALRAAVLAVLANVAALGESAGESKP